MERLFKKYNPSRGSRMTDSRENIPVSRIVQFILSSVVADTDAVIGFDREKRDRDYFVTVRLVEP